MEDMEMRNYDLTPLLRATVGFDRMFNMLDTATRLDEGVPSYPPYNIEKIGEDRYHIVMAVAGFAEDNVFDQLTAYMRFLYKKALVAEIYRPAAETMVFYEDQLAAILEATTDAGKELIASRKVSPETMDKILKPLVTK